MFFEFVRHLIDRNRIVVSLLIVLTGLSVTEITLGIARAARMDTPTTELTFGIDFAPEIWLGILALILGTLIIVISIASQSTPKLIDLYLRHWISLIYIWFIKLCLIQSLILQNTDFPVGSPLLNTFVYLPLGAFFALPYVLYILKQTKTSTIIEVVYREFCGRLRHLSSPRLQAPLRRPPISSRYHGYCFNTVNQLDDLLSFASLKEPKALAIARLGGVIRRYVEVKPRIETAFKRDSAVARQDVTFLTFEEQWTKLEEGECVFELKGLRVLTRAYARLIGQDEYDLASLSASQFVEIAKTAVESRDRHLVEVTVVCFNTLMRFALKHGIKYREVRNLFNLLFFYRQLIIETADRDDPGFLHQTCDYLKIYAKEIYEISTDIPSFVFLTEVCVSEMRTVLVHIEEADWPLEEQEYVLDTMLELDDMTQVDIRDWKRRFGVRTIQVGLALFYIKQDRPELANRIIRDIVAEGQSDHGAHLIDELVAVVRRLRESTEEFWEDTDRGKLNIYYSPDVDAIPRFIGETADLLAETYPALDTSGLREL